jgi:thiol:disulfide interchange protein
MITFKQFLAFPLLLAVVWFIRTVDPEYRIAALTIAVMVGMACWLIGRVPAYAELPEKLRTWILGAAVVAVSCMISITYFGPRDIIKWEPYNEAQLQELVASGRPVFIDFTASWCSTCQVNSLVAIETQDVAEALRKHNFVPMLADWSKPNPAIAQKVQELNSNSIPLLAIYPAGNLDNPIVLRDSVLKGTVLNAIEKAVGESKTGNSSQAVATMTAEPTVPSKAVATVEKSTALESVSKIVKSEDDSKNLKISKPVIQSVGKQTGVR